MKRKSFKQRFIITAMAGAFMIPGSAGVVHAEDVTAVPPAGIEAAADNSYQVGDLLSSEAREYSDMAFAGVSDYTYIRSAPSMDSDWNGKLYSGNAATVLDTVGAWSYISSGTVTGYVLTGELYTGDSAREYEANNPRETATVTADVLNVRSGQSTDYDILTQILMDEQYSVQGEAIDGWYPLQVGDISGWVSGDYVTIESHESYAESKEEELARLAEEENRRIAEEEAQRQAEEAAAQAEKEAAEVAAQVADSGQSLIDYACQFIGNPYVWGGTSLTEGADCSGFIQTVYADFGISLPRTSGEMRSAGYEVSYEEALPGDIICYEGHVGLYMGDGTIVNAIDSDHGIGISNATFTDIITIRRMF